ncbi:MAG: late competence development ComFB family protein [Spirochaetales bacterium]|nr:late competence development ComFB family protein [Spirochaetales bacterium]
MEIHNIVEDIVYETAFEIFKDEEVSKKAHFCTCSQCLKDAVCFALNRIDPVYIFSSRGASHFKMNYLDNLQRKADIVALIHKGIDRVIKVKRPHFPHDGMDISEDSAKQGSYFNFPIVSGKMLDSKTFAPVSDIEISLMEKGVPVKMINPNWQNPYLISPVTPGIFSFFPFPLEAKKSGIEREFELELTTHQEKYEPLTHYFKLTIVSENIFSDYFNYNNYFDLKDIHLIPKK